MSLKINLIAIFFLLNFACLSAQNFYGPSSDLVKVKDNIYVNAPTPPAVISAMSRPGVQDHPEFAAVHAAIEDYVFGLYLVDAQRIVNSVDTTLHKTGFWFNNETMAYVDNLKMTYTQLVDLAAEWNKSGDQITPESPREITIFDITDKTASAKLVAAWGMDYFHLAKVDKKWKIRNVLWQSLPKAK